MSNRPQLEETEFSKNRAVGKDWNMPDKSITKVSSEHAPPFGQKYLVPKGSRHTYKVTETFTAVEATSPPAEVHGRDE
jgi:hypothetical protein